MHIRLVFALALFFVSIIGGYGLQASHGGYCTVEEIEQWYLSGELLVKIEDHCLDLNVQCTATRVFYMIDEGYSVPDIYYECG